MIYGLIPAGGKSRRMGRPKLALPLGEHCVLARVVSAVRDAGIEVVLVVVGPHVAELAPLAEAAGAQVLLLEQETADMRATLEHGLRWLDDRYHPRADDGWLLVPADHPTLDADVIRLLLQARSERSDRSIVVPTFRNQRGHPTLIDWRHVACLRAWPADQGLNLYLRQHAAETLEVPVPSAEILRDLDTPEEYEQLRQRWN